MYVHVQYLLTCTHSCGVACDLCVLCTSRRASVPPALSSGSGSPVGSLSAAMKSARSEEHIPTVPRSDVRLCWGGGGREGDHQRMLC